MLHIVLMLALIREDPPPEYFTSNNLILKLESIVDYF